MVPLFRRAVAEARRHGNLYFAALLSQDRILKAFGTARANWQGWIYTPAVTVWTFLSQCLSPDHSCREAVARFLAWRLAQGLPRCSAGTGGYCTARGHLPEEVPQRLMQDIGKEVEDEAPATWLWHGRKVRVADGSTLTMPDTPANQAAYPQQKSQKPGCGFPIARIVVIFSLSVGTVLEAAFGKYRGKQTGENSLLRGLHEALADGDVFLADRYFSGWCDIALLVQRGIDVVIRRHQLRTSYFFPGRWLSENDHLVSWSKPARPAWMSREQYAQLPGRVDGARGAGAGGPKRLSHAVAGGGDHAAGCRGVSARGDRLAVPAALAGGIVFAEPEDRVADGPVAVQDAGSGPQRVLDTSARLQPDSRRDGPSGLDVGPSAVGNQFQGHVANAQSVSSVASDRDFQQSVVHGIVGRHRKPSSGPSPRSHRTTPSQTPPQALPIPLSTAP
jgi:hypothetical protein